MKRLIAKGKDWYCNLPVTRIERDEAIVFAYYDEEFVAAFDIGCVDVLYVSKQSDGR